MVSSSNSFSAYTAEAWCACPSPISAQFPLSCPEALENCVNITRVEGHTLLRFCVGAGVTPMLVDNVWARTELHVAYLEILKLCYYRNNSELENFPKSQPKVQNIVASSSA
jgi:hypothetical protein